MDSLLSVSFCSNKTFFFLPLLLMLHDKNWPDKAQIRLRRREKIWNFELWRQDKEGLASQIRVSVSPVYRSGQAKWCCNFSGLRKPGLTSHSTMSAVGQQRGCPRGVFQGWGQSSPHLEQCWLPCLRRGSLWKASLEQFSDPAQKRHVSLLFIIYQSELLTDGSMSHQGQEVRA